MATAGVLEKSEKKAFLDDTTPLTAIFITHRVVPKQNYVEYVMRVQRGPAQEEFWEVKHRYSDFSKLAVVLQPCEAASALPPKKVFGTTDQQFVVERQVGLEKFLSAILKDPFVRNHMEVKKFLDPVNYPCNFFDRGLQSVSMFFRSEPSWKIEENLRDLGWRIRKQYFLIKSKADPKMPCHLLTRCEPGPDFSLGLKELKACLKVLTDIQHPFILSPTLADFDDTALMVVRPFISSGSLKDAIYDKLPKGPALLKYGLPPRMRKLSLDNMKQYGRQILEALNFLAEKGFVLGQVHTGNVLIHGGNCKLVDIENALMGVPSPYRHYLVEIKKIRSHVGETVYGFGQMLYEMWTGAPLGKASLDSCPTSFPLDIGKIIDSILTPKAFKEGLPSLTDLLGNPFFTAGYGVPGSEKPHLRVPSKMKEALRVHLEKAENRLLAEQKKVAQYQRLSKVQENLMSEDERLKRRKLRKKQMSLQEEDAPQAYPTTTSLPRQNTIGTSGISHSSKRQPSSSSSSSSSTPAPSSTTPTTNGSSPTTGATRTPKNTNSSNSKNAPSKTKPPASKALPPQSSAVPEARPAPPANKERGALLGSIEGFTKGKLKKAKTNDRSCPKV